jgi:hypothetical protein
VSGAPAILARLSALGACIERRGDKLILCAGARPVPRPLVELARAAKADLLRLIDKSAPPKALTEAPKAFKDRKGEHLWQEGSISAAKTQGSRLRCSLPGPVSIYGVGEHLCGGGERPENAAVAEPVESGAPAPEPSRSEAEAATVIAPLHWFAADPAKGEPPYDEPCPARRGVIRRPHGRFEHFCAVCGAWGGFGYGITGEQLGRWYCFTHRPTSEP